MIRLWKWCAAGGALAPAVWVAGAVSTGRAGADPVEYLLHFTGNTAFILLLVTLGLGPAARLSGFWGIAAPRRWLGVLTFCWAFAHLGVWIGLDQFFAWTFAWRELQGRPYLWAGLFTFAVLALLTATSTDGWMRRLGRARWSLLHKLAYVAAGTALLHQVLQVRADYAVFYLYAAALGVIIAARLASMAVTGSNKRGP